MPYIHDSQNRPADKKRVKTTSTDLDMIETVQQQPQNAHSYTMDITTNKLKYNLNYPPCVALHFWGHNYVAMSHFWGHRIVYTPIFVPLKTNGPRRMSPGPQPTPPRPCRSKSISRNAGHCLLLGCQASPQTFRGPPAGRKTRSAPPT